MRIDGGRGCSGDPGSRPRGAPRGVGGPGNVIARRSRGPRAVAALAVLALTAIGVAGGAGVGRVRAQDGAVPLREYPVPGGSHPHDVAPAPDGTVWFTAQTAGALGRLDPATGKIREIKLGEGSAPHGVIVGPDGAAWVTDGGLNAIVRVSPTSDEVRRFPLPTGRAGANLNTAVFDRQGILWFTGQGGVYGRVTPATGRVDVWDAPKGPGPYGITVTPGGAIYFASLAGSYVGRIDTKTA